MCGQHRRLDPGVQELRCSLLLAFSFSAHPPTLVLPLCSSRALWWFWGHRVFASEASFTLRSHSSMAKLVVPLWVGRLSAFSRSLTTICCAGCFAGTGFSRVPGHRHFFVRWCPWSMAMELLARCLPHAARLRQSLSLSLHACTVTVIGATGHICWGVVETGLSAKTRGRTGDCTLCFYIASSAYWFLFKGAV